MRRHSMICPGCHGNEVIPADKSVREYHEEDVLEPYEGRLAGVPMMVRPCPECLNSDFGPGVVDAEDYI